MGGVKVIKINANEFRYIGLFEAVTGASVRDCIVKGDRVTFVVKGGDMGLAIGKGGINVKKVESSINKKVDLIEYSKDAVQFVKNIIHPIKPKNIYMSQKSDGSKVINVMVESRDKKILLSSRKKRFNELKDYVKRHHIVDDIEVK